MIPTYLTLIQIFVGQHLHIEQLKNRSLSSLYSTLCTVCQHIAWDSTPLSKKSMDYSILSLSALAINVLPSPMHLDINHWIINKPSNWG